MSLKDDVDTLTHLIQDTTNTPENVVRDRIDGIKGKHQGAEGEIDMEIWPLLLDHRPNLLFKR